MHPLMTVMNADLPAALRNRTVTVTESAPAVTETVAVVSERRDYLMTDATHWSWSQLRDYVVAEIEARFGAIPRDTRKEAGIFRRFLTTWGAQSGPIAKCAFEEYDGWWQNAPISITRFCRGSDPYFAAVIAQRLSPAG